MKRLKKIVTCIPFITQFKNLYRFHVIIQALNITSLIHQHYDHIRMTITFKCFTFYVLYK